MINVAVIGSSGAIGNAFLEAYIADPQVQKIYSFSKSKITTKDKRVVHINIDITDEKSIENAALSVKGNLLDQIIIATGLLHNQSFGPEKSIKDIKKDNFTEIFSVNTIGPALIGKFFIPLLNKKERSHMAFLSARVGSISDNRLGGWYSYRASKSALNQIIKNFSIETKRTNSKAIIIGLQPGTVKSNLSQPFQKNVKEGNMFSPQDSVSALMKVINKTTEGDSGNLIGWDGKTINP